MGESLATLELFLTRWCLKLAYLWVSLSQHSGVCEWERREREGGRCMGCGIVIMGCRRFRAPIQKEGREILFDSTKQRRLTLSMCVIVCLLQWGDLQAWHRTWTQRSSRAPWALTMATEARQLTPTTVVAPTIRSEAHQTRAKGGHTFPLPHFIVASIFFNFNNFWYMFFINNMQRRVWSQGQIIFLWWKRAWERQAPRKRKVIYIMQIYSYWWREQIRAEMACLGQPT